jgi:hypothetical protein
MRSFRGRLSRNLRKLTASIRLLPDFLIIGAQRCGTTSLYRYLCSHPWIAPATKKETHYFDLHYDRADRWYRRHFPTWLYKRYCQYLLKQDIITGEATPMYLFHPLSPHRIAGLLPDIKLIVLLRNPIDRAYSNYWHEVRRGNETLSFDEAIDHEPDRVQGERERIILHHGRCYAPAFWQHSYLARGIYNDQLRVWHKLYPREQFLILRSEDFYAAPAKTLDKVFDFLGLPSWELKDHTIYQNGSYPQMPVPTRKKLKAYFQPHNERLYAFLGYDFDW